MQKPNRLGAECAGRKAKSPENGLFWQQNQVAIRLITIFLMGASLTCIAQPLGNQAVVIGNHPAVYDSAGMLLHWTSWHNAVPAIWYTS